MNKYYVLLVDPKGKSDCIPLENWERFIREKEYCRKNKTTWMQVKKAMNVFLGTNRCRKLGKWMVLPWDPNWELKNVT